MPRQSSTKVYQPQGKRSSQTPTKENVQPPVKRPAKQPIPPPPNPWSMWRGRIIIVVVILLIGAGSWYILSNKLSVSTTPSDVTIANNNAQTATHSLLNSNVEATASALPTTNWQTFQMLTGHNTNGTAQNTQKFTVPAKWQLNWACQGTNGVDDWLNVAIYNADGSLYDAGAQITCLAAQKIVGSEIESKSGSGTVYLAIAANTDWTITMRAPK